MLHACLIYDINIFYIIFSQVHQQQNEQLRKEKFENLCPKCKCWHQKLANMFKVNLINLKRFYAMKHFYKLEWKFQLNLLVYK